MGFYSEGTPRNLISRAPETPQGLGDFHFYVHVHHDGGQKRY
jgi:hypothetical protein